MVLIQLDLTEKADKKARLYKEEHDLKDKKEAINEMIEKFKGE